MTINIDTSLVHRLIKSQFPQWASLPIRPVENSGWDNRTFHLGSEMVIRLPSGSCYADQVKKEQYWLPRLAPHLSLSIPTPIALGQPSADYPWHWSIYRWLPGQTASKNCIDDMNLFAEDLAKFLLELQSIDSAGGPPAGKHSFYRGGSLTTYDKETQQAIKLLGNQIDAKTIAAIWEESLSSSWQREPVWIHGDIAVGNLLVEKARLRAVIDFGQLAIGDPACDLVIAWSFFKDESRKVFRGKLNLDRATWSRARGWALWKALIVSAKLSGTNPDAIEASWKVIDEILLDHEY